MSKSSSSNSQPLPTPTPDTVSQGLKPEASSSQGDFYPQVQDAMGLLGLQLPRNVMSVRVQRETLGQFPPVLLNHPVQPSLVSGTASPVYTHGAQSVPQPPSSDRYQPRPLDAPAHLTVYSAIAKAILKKPGFANIPMDILLRVVPGLIETIWKEAGGRNKDTIGDGVGTSEAADIIDNTMSVSESTGLPDMGVPAMEAAPMQLPELSLTVQPKQLPLVEQPQSVPTISDNIRSSMGFPTVTPMIQSPEYSLAVGAARSGIGLAHPIHEDLEGPPRAVPNSQGYSIELGSEEIMDETRTASQILDEILHDGLVDYI